MNEFERNEFERADTDKDGLEFDWQLRQALQRRSAPESLKWKVMERRKRARAERAHVRLVWLQRLAASVVLAGILGGTLLWRNVEQRRKGEAARQQVLTALRIASHALDQMNAQINNKYMNSN